MSVFGLLLLLLLWRPASVSWLVVTHKLLGFVVVGVIVFVCGC